MQKVKITLENEKGILPTLYPTLIHRGKMTKYDPEKHQLEKGEAVQYLDIETGIIKKGVVKEVVFSNPFLYPIYTIGKKTYMRHRVWPNVEDAKKHKADRKNALSKLTRKDRKVLGV